jgi:hypothetical protein
MMVLQNNSEVGRKYPVPYTESSFEKGISRVTQTIYSRSLDFLLGILRPNSFVVSEKLGFNVHGPVHRNNILMYIQQDATLHTLFYLNTALHVSRTPPKHTQTGSNSSTIAAVSSNGVTNTRCCIDTVVCAPDDDE